MSTRNPVEGPLRSLFELSERVPFSLPDPVTEGWSALGRLRAARTEAQAANHCEEMLAEQCSRGSLQEDQAADRKGIPRRARGRRAVPL